MLLVTPTASIGLLVVIFIKINEIFIKCWPRTGNPFIPIYPIHLGSLSGKKFSNFHYILAYIRDLDQALGGGRDQLLPSTYSTHSCLFQIEAKLT